MNEHIDYYDSERLLNRAEDVGHLMTTRASEWRAVEQRLQSLGLTNEISGFEAGLLIADIIEQEVRHGAALVLETRVRRTET